MVAPVAVATEELRKFVQEGELSANEKRTVLDLISRLRPGAQRVNLVG